MVEKLAIKEIQGELQHRKTASSRGRKQEADRDDLIVSATLELLTETGYYALTMSEVAVRAGVSKATLYRRWSAKPELVADAVSTIAFTPAPYDPGHSLRDDVMNVLTQASACSERPHVLRIASEAARSSPSLGKTLRERFVDHISREMHVLGARAVDEGYPSLTVNEMNAIVETTAALLIYVSAFNDRNRELATRHELVDHVLMVLLIGRRVSKAE